VSGRTNTPEGFVIFDDVFVPNERIFLDGEVASAALFAHSLGLWERLGGLTGMADGADVMVGLAQLIAEANGLAGQAHIKEKISEMIIHATVVRACLEAATSHAQSGVFGAIFVNDPNGANLSSHWRQLEFALPCFLLGGNGCFLQITEAACVVVDHNTIFHTGNVIMGYGQPNTDFAFTNNLTRNNEYGVIGDGVGAGKAALERYFPAAQFTENVLVGGRHELYPAGNYFPPALDPTYADKSGQPIGSDVAQLRNRIAKVQVGD